MIGHTQPRRLAARTWPSDRRGARRRARRTPSATRSASPTRSATATLVKLMTDGILLAELQRDRRAAALRHDHHRRGPRAQPQHRLPPRLPQAAAAPPARPQGRSSPRRPSTPSASPRHFGRDVRTGRRGVRADLPGRGALPPARRASRDADGRRPRPSVDQITGHLRRRRRAVAREPRRATSSCSCPASARSATPPTPCARCDLPRHRGRCRSTPGCRRPSSTGCSPPHPGRRIVLATNVAETSLTVPGIRYVVDPGTARISRYSQRTKVQRLPIEAVSQAVGQPAGRPLRPRRRRHLHPALRRGRLRGPAASSPSRDPAHQPGLGHPADDRARPGRHRGLPVPRPARPRARSPTASRCSRSSARSSRRRAPERAHRLGRRAGPAADRPAARPHGARGRHATAACARC